MTEDAQDGPTLNDRLAETGSKLASLGLKAGAVTRAGISATAEATKVVVERAGGAGKNAVDKASAAGKGVVGKATETTKNAMKKANSSVKNTVEGTKNKLEARREGKIAETKEALSSEPIFDDVPPMVVLPEFEQQRMEVVNEQQTNQILMLEEMQRLSSRVDRLEKRNRMLSDYAESHGIDLPEESGREEENPNDVVQFVSAGGTITELIHVLGTSLLFIGVLMGLDYYVNLQEMTLNGIYPADFAVWSFGSFAWMSYLLHRLTKINLIIPVSVRLQIALAFGITILVGLMMSTDPMVAVSNAWILGIVFMIIVLASSILATAWRSTRRLVRVRETIELID